ncbi:MAG: hypothetical protein QOH01_1927 [Verrucomicrobiota bacterium]|jgi:hypothetical protein
MKNATVPIFCALTTALVVHAILAADRPSPSPAFKEIILNEKELVCVDRVLVEMKRRHFPFDRLQLVIRSDPDFYSLLFVEDAINPKPNENDTAIAWHVRKHDLKVEGPIFQR